MRLSVVGFLRPCLAFAALTLAAGCAQLPGTSGTPENTAPPVDALEDPNHPGLEACSEGVAVADVDATLAIASDFKDSCHEMVVCGGLSASFSTTLIKILINAAAGDSTQPSGFVFDGGGTYSAGMQMVVSLRLGADTSFGAKGDLITFDVFDISNYFTGATITASASIDTNGNTKTSLGIEFTGLGPGIELLGLGPSPSSPITIDSGEIAEALGRIELSSTITVDDEKGSSHILYHLQGDATPLSTIIDSGDMPMSLVDVVGSSADTGQALEITNWAMLYQSGSSGTLDGSIAFEVRGGGAFPYSVKFAYPHRKAPDVTLGCLPE